MGILSACNFFYILYFTVFKQVTYTQKYSTHDHITTSTMGMLSASNFLYILYFTVFKQVQSQLHNFTNTASKIM
jgi:hypothetical protein